MQQYVLPLFRLVYSASFTKGHEEEPSVSGCGQRVTVLAESPDEVVRTFAYFLGEVHLLDPVEDHGVNLDGIRASKGGAGTRRGSQILVVWKGKISGSNGQTFKQ